MSASHVPIRDSLVVLLTITTGAVDAASFLALGHHVQVRPAAVLGQPRPYGAGVARPRVPAVQVVLRDDPVAAQYPPH